MADFHRTKRNAGLALLYTSFLLIAVFLVIVNSIGRSAFFRSLDISLIHWLLEFHPFALRGLSPPKLVTLSLSPASQIPGVKILEMVWIDKALRQKLLFHLEDYDLSGQDLSEVDFSYADLKKVNLAGSRLNSAIFDCAEIGSAGAGPQGGALNLKGAKLQHASFDYRKCIGDRENKTIYVDFPGADLTGARITGHMKGVGPRATCEGKLLIEGNLTGAKFTSAFLNCVELKNTARSSQSKRGGSEGDDGDKRRFGLPHAGISFRSAWLKDVTLDSGNFVFSDFDHARILLLVVNTDKTGQPAETNYSSFTNIRCQLKPLEPQNCLLINRAGGNPPALHLNFSSSTITTNLVESEDDTRNKCYRKIEADHQADVDEFICSTSTILKNIETSKGDAGGSEVPPKVSSAGS